MRLWVTCGDGTSLEKWLRGTGWNCPANQAGALLWSGRKTFYAGIFLFDNLWILVLSVLSGIGEL
jgi:hypothetical protein